VLQNDSLGFAPEELDLTHLDQIQGPSAAPATIPFNHENGQPLHQAHAQQLTHLDSQGRAQMVDVGQVRCGNCLTGVVHAKQLCDDVSPFHAEESHNQSCNSIGNRPSEQCSFQRHSRRKIG